MLHCLDCRIGVKMWIKKDKEQKNKRIENIEPIDNSGADIVWMRRMISHNIRMPMSIIRGYGDVLKQNLIPNEEKDKVIDIICENVMYLDQILSVIFESNETQEVLLTKVNISEVIKKVVSYVREIAKKRNIKTTLSLESDELYVDAHLVPVMRIFYQILENSFKYLSPGDNLSIKAYCVGNDILIVYKDDGMGVNKDEISHIFEEGFRGGNVESKNGSGFGLYDVKNIVSDYNGTIKAISREDEGVSIFITFPQSKL